MTVDKKKVEIANKEQADAILESLNGSEFKVTKVRKELQEGNHPPFITSTLQQEASRFGVCIKANYEGCYRSYMRY